MRRKGSSVELDSAGKREQECKGEGARGLRSNERRRRRNGYYYYYYYCKRMGERIIEGSKEVRKFRGESRELLRHEFYFVQ